MTYRRAS